MKNLGKNWLKLLLTSLFGLTTFLMISTVSFAITPTLSTIKYQDVNNNGAVDTILLTYSADLTTCGTVVIGDYSAYVANDITGSLLTGGSMVCSDVSDTVTITLGTPGNFGITGNTTAPTITYTGASGKLTDGVASNFAVTLTAQAIADGAAPVIKSSTYKDSVSNDGKIDTITATYSESVVAASTLAANNLTFGNVGSFTGALFGASASDLISGTVATTDITLGTAATAVTTRDATGLLAFTVVGTANLQDAAGNNNSTIANLIPSGATYIDGAAPIIVSATMNQSSGTNTMAFKYSEAINGGSCTAGGASSATCADITNAANALTFVGLGAFGNSNIVVPTTGNTYAFSTGSVANDTVTVTLAGNSSYMKSSGSGVAITSPSSTFTPVANNNFKDTGGLNQVNSTATVSMATTTAWDVTPPTISSGILSDTYYNDNTFIAGGTFSTGNDGKIDTVTITASETLKTIADAAGSRNDWTTSPAGGAGTVTGNAGEYGTGLTVIKATASGTTYTLNFSGALMYYPTVQFTSKYIQDAVPSFVDRAGNVLTGAGIDNDTRRVCVNGFSCLTAASVGSYSDLALLTVSITQPTTLDTTPPSAPTSFKATVNASSQVVLTWVDPTASDLNQIRIYKTDASGNEIPFANVNKAVLTYTDTTTKTGEAVKYRIRAFDQSGNQSVNTDLVSVTVTPPAATTTTTTTTTTPATTTTTTPATTPATTTTPDTSVTPDDEEEEDTTETDTTDMEEPAEVPAVTLKDTAKHWAKTEIAAMVEMGIIKGHKDGNFKPDEKLNRADTAYLLCRVMGLDEEEAATKDPFSDVKKGAAYAGCVAQLKEEGITKGNADGTYKPSANINRAEFVTLAMRAYSTFLEDEEKTTFDAALNAKEAKASFSDVNAKTDWYAAAAALSMENGFVKGRTCGKDKCFDGKTEITRAEATVVLYRIFKDLI